jgi:hypothetical protein
VSDARIETFLQQQGWASARRTPVDAQASTRLFTRLTNETGKSAILMDTGGITRALPKHPYEQTIMPDFRPFVQVDRILSQPRHERAGDLRGKRGWSFAAGGRFRPH